MLSGIVCNLNTAFSFGRTGGFKLGQVCNSVKYFVEEPRLQCGHFGFCLETRFSGKQFGTGGNSLFIVQKDSSCIKIMAASGSATASGDVMVDNLLSSCGNVSNFTKPVGVYFNNRVGSRSFQTSSMRMKRREPYNNHQLVRGYFIFDITRRSCSSSPDIDSSSKNWHASSTPFYSDGSIPDMTVNGLSCNEQLATTTLSPDQNDLSERTLKLFSGSCYLPHPDKEETGGEDAHFICANEQVIGVADGVGGWADVGINAGLYARELMSNSVGAILDEPKDSIDPAKVLTRAHCATKAKGSSTACIICLKDKGIHAINLGDSGFIIVRDSHIVFESPVQQHGFNFTYQLENSSRGDQPGSGQVFMIPVVPGDVIVAGTDGLFDNLFNNEVTSIVVDGMREGLNPEALSQKIAAFARKRALDKRTKTPFSTAAQEAGFRYLGGKLDDITVVVSYISSSSTN